MEMYFKILILSKIIFSVYVSATITNDLQTTNLLSNFSIESNAVILDENVTEISTESFDSNTENDDSRREQRVYFRPLFVYRQEQKRKQDRIKTTANPDRNGHPLSHTNTQTHTHTQTQSPHSIPFQPWPGTYVPSSDGTHYIYYPSYTPAPSPSPQVAYVQPFYVYPQQTYQSSSYYPQYYEHKYPSSSSNQYYWPSSSSNYQYSYSSPSSYSTNYWK